MRRLINIRIYTLKDTVNGMRTMTCIMNKLISLIFILLFSGIGLHAEVRIGAVPISPETDPLYLQYIKYLTVPPDKHSDPKFLGQDIAQIKTLEDAVRREIYDKMSLAVTETFPFANIQQAQQLWLMRLTAIDNMNKMNSGVIKFRYYTKEKPPSPGSPKWKKRAENDFFFVVNQGQTSYDAIKSLLSGTVYGECAGAISACIFDGAATALGQGQFDQIHPAGTLGIGWQAPIKKHIYQGSSVNIIIPGDLVYFKNKSDYLEKCAKRNFNGYWQGENCVYLGGGFFAGLGARSPSGSFKLTAEEMREELKTAYEGDTQSVFTGVPATEIKILPPQRLWLSLSP